MNRNRLGADDGLLAWILQESIGTGPGAGVHGCESCIQRSVYRLQPVAAETSKSTQLNPV
ncbi:hypothetical protein [Faecalibaculum rodentium]|uniref:hypothetical protein n=1 Tax=Faecalibaculum rodentium TaxID=1702221 RepID=UPI0026F3ABD5|nr:hypothetical protein [Faecalibaculum rodentium]